MKFVKKMIKQKLKIQRVLLTTVVAFGLASCVSLNSHQTGRTVGKDDYAAFANVNLGIDPDPIHQVEVGAFHGIKENLDLGVKINSFFHLTGLSKLQIIGNKNSLFASSIGMNIGITPYGLPVGLIGYSSTLSLFNSIHPTDYLAFTFSPTYHYFGYADYSKIKTYNTVSNIYGYSVGVIVGKKHQVSLELLQFENNVVYLLYSEPIISLGYILNFE